MERAADGWVAPLIDKVILLLFVHKKKILPGFLWIVNNGVRLDRAERHFRVMSLGG